jgi:hypothetical protein
LKTPKNYNLMAAERSFAHIKQNSRDYPGDLVVLERSPVSQRAGMIIFLINELNAPLSIHFSKSRRDYFFFRLIYWRKASSGTGRKLRALRR